MTEEVKLLRGWLDHHCPTCGRRDCGAECPGADVEWREKFRQLLRITVEGLVN